MSEIELAEGKKSIDRALTSAKVLVCVGSGGVGKTTTSAALAIAAARRGRRCAVLTIDPAKRLAQALGIDSMGNAPRRLPQELTGSGTVDAMMLETGDAFDDLIFRLVPDADKRQRLFDTRLYQVIARQLGGTHEYMAVEKLYALTRDDQYDLVVLDTPPSVNALDFLDAPGRLTHFFSDRIAGFFVRRKEDEKRGLFQKLKNRAGEIALSLLGKALGKGFIEEMQDFSTAFAELFTEFQKRGVVTAELLQDSETAFLVISGADPARVSEALDFARVLKRFGIRPRAFVANRVHIAAADSKACLDDVGLDKDVVSALENARTIRASLASRDRRGLVQMAKAAGKGRLLVVPELDHEVEDRGAIEYVISSLTD